MKNHDLKRKVIPKFFQKPVVSKMRNLKNDEGDFILFFQVKKAKKADNFNLTV